MELANTIEPMQDGRSSKDQFCRCYLKLKGTPAEHTSGPGALSRCRADGRGAYVKMTGAAQRSLPSSVRSKIRCVLYESHQAACLIEVALVANEVACLGPPKCRVGCSGRDT
jgi:hypothetical protein